VLAVDTNVLVYAADADSQFHVLCRDWLERQRARPDAWCAIRPPPSSSMNSIKRRRPVAPPCGTAAKLPLSTYEFPESEIAGHWMKIAIVVEQRCTVFDAPGPDQEVDRLADCDPARRKKR
jgi:predicted nucleic acid-binding protein